jgi:hypothetical protein
VSRCSHCGHRITSQGRVLITLEKGIYSKRPQAAGVSYGVLRVLISRFREEGYDIATIPLGRGQGVLYLLRTIDGEPNPWYGAKIKELKE